MSEKRFVLDYEDDDTIFIDDNKLKKHLTIRNVKIKMGDLNDIVDRLNQLNDENEQLQKKNKIWNKMFNDYQNSLFDLHKKYDKLEKGNDRLRKKLECCEYSHFLNELDEIHKKIDEGDLSDFSPLKEDE